MKYGIVHRDDYNKELTIGKEKVQCYSHKQLKAAYEDDEYEIIGEARLNKKGNDEKVDVLAAGGKNLTVFEYGENSSARYKKAGYVCVGEDRYIVILQGREPFYLALLSVLLVSLITVGTIYYVSPRRKGETNADEQVELINQLPPLDANIERVGAQDAEEPASTEDLQGGGKVALKYEPEAHLDLASGKVELSFENPNRSSHDMVLSLYVISGDKEYFLAKSGRIPSDYRLTSLEATGDTLKLLTQGQYEAKYYMEYYDAHTGEKALVNSNLQDIKLIVK